MSEQIQIEDLDVGDQITYSFGSDEREALLVGIEDGRLWILSGDQTVERNRERPSYIEPRRVVDVQEDEVEEETPTPTEDLEPPSSAPKYLREGLGKQSPETLREIAEYADRLADQKEREAERELEERAADVGEDELPEEWDSEEWDDAVDDVDAPANATLTTKTIDERDYFYYQWREGSKIKSEYVAPVTPSDSGN